MPVPHGACNYSFINFEVRNAKSSNSACIFQDYCSHSWHFIIPYNFGSFCQVLQKMHFEIAIRMVWNVMSLWRAVTLAVLGVRIYSEKAL
jgi:hypothetical protein